ncbi:MAG: hypothetical protein KJ593_07405 [Candidatus Omnitrophica bacterium]|nr:hypothetical protein [Candidatus Omnitrophota bacterium]
MRSLIEKNLERTSIQTSLPAMLKTLRYFCLSMTSILLSLIFPIAELQFLVLAIITGAKWITDSKHNGIIIIERG